MWFMGTNDQPGDYRTSGCGACHVIYANDREPRHSLTYAEFGRDGMSPVGGPDHPEERARPSLKHVFTRSIPTSTCMSCHMHQPNVFLNSYLGYTMWDYESEAPSMWPKTQKYPTIAEQRTILDRNPEGAAVRGKWGDVNFLRNVTDLNPTLKETQFADYHGHGWNFRGIYKRDRKGNLLDKDGKIISPDDPEKWRRPGDPKFEPVGQNIGKAVHMMSVHAEVGMQCADCHFAQDSHGNGMMQGEVANAVEIGCKDCHGTADAYPTLRTSNVDARPGRRRPDRAPQPRRPAPLRVDREGRAPRPHPALHRRSQAAVGSVAGEGQRRSHQPQVQREVRPGEADEQRSATVLTTTAGGWT